MNHKKHALFSSRWGFILSAVGSAVGMANVWGFPAKMGSYGGSAFLIAYLIFVALFGIVGLSAEYAIGRRARTGTVGAYKYAWATRGAKMGKAGGLLGWLPLIGSMCIAIGYAVIVAYVLKAFFHSVTGELMRVDTCSQQSCHRSRSIVTKGQSFDDTVAFKHIEKSAQQFPHPDLFTVKLKNFQQKDKER